MKKIGIDLTSLQGAHRMRGIGYTLINFINHMPASERKKCSFVFYTLPPTKGKVDPLTLLQLHDIDYELREIKLRRRSHRSLPGRLSLLVSVFNQLVEIRDLHFGDSRFSRKNLKGVGIFLQTDPVQGLPRKFRMKKYLILYDVIPYVVSWEYLWPYSYARHKQGFSRKASLRCQARRWLFAYKYRVVLRRANKLIAISNHTRDDFIRYFSVPEKKILASPLGVTPPAHSTVSEPRLHKYINTSWGYMKRPLSLDPDTPFLLFVGGADRRRKIEDMVAAFNQVRATGQSIKLVLAGDSMQGPAGIATEETQTALKRSSYLDDIIFMGFVDDDERDWLYRNARAFVFPSRYEGFGLPVLEAMIHECPVISYHNAATNEVAGNVPIYVSDVLGLKDAMQKMISLAEPERQRLVNRGLKQAEKFSWEKTSRSYLEILND